MNQRVLLIPAAVALLTACESYREHYFTGEIKTPTATFQCMGKKAPEGSSRTTPTTAEWNFYPEGVDRILAIRSPRQQNYSGFQIACPSNSFGVYLLPRAGGPLNASNEVPRVVLQGSLVFRSPDGSAFDIDAQSVDGSEGIHGSFVDKRDWEFQPMLPFAGLAMMFGAGGAKSTSREQIGGQHPE